MPALRTRNPKWNIIPSEAGCSPPGRIGHTFCANNSGTTAYVYGGVNDTEDTVSNYLDDLWEYSVLTKKWVQLPLHGAVQCSRAFHTAIWWGESMYIFGGCNGRGRFNKLFTVDKAGFCAVVNSPTPPPLTRYCHSAVLFEGSMYIFGGKCGGRNSNKRLSDLYMCTLDQPLWIVCPQHGDVPPPRSAHTALTHERTMLTFGGRNAKGECCEDLYMYHFDTHLWTRVYVQQPPLFGRARNSAVSHYGNVVVFGGWNGRKKLNDLFVYNVEANTFDIAYDVDQECPSRRECHVAVMCRNTMVVFGGRFRGNFMNDTAELYLGPKVAAESARDWLIRAGGLPLHLEDSLPLRLTQFFSVHEQLHQVMDV